MVDSKWGEAVLSNRKQGQPQGRSQTVLQSGITKWPGTRTKQAYLGAGLSLAAKNSFSCFVDAKNYTGASQRRDGASDPDQAECQPRADAVVILKQAHHHGRQVRQSRPPEKGKCAQKEW